MRALLLFAVPLILLSCNNRGDAGTAAGGASDTASVPAPERPSVLALKEVSESPAFPDARLTLTQISAVSGSGDSVHAEFTFGVEGFDLKAQTPDAGGKMCANSAQGQHIHFILDNRPYVALYEPVHKVTLTKNTEHTLVCFLSRSYHESVKTSGAAINFRFTVNGEGEIRRQGDVRGPAIVYSRPKGDYLGADTANILLDFYLLGASLGDRLKVKADVVNETNGRSTSFTISEWKPQAITGLGTGKAKVTLTLVDGDGKPLEGPMTTVTREGIRLAAKEPM